MPYSDVVPMLAATVESDEGPATASFLGTAWWSYEAAASGPLLVQVSNCCGEARVYTGDSVASLEEVPGTSSFSRRIFQAEAGTTYMFQVGHTGNVCCGGLLGLSISEAPSISTAAMYQPFDPSSFDTVQFSAHVFDPAAFPTESVHWNFGDGGTAEEHGASHRYLADGDYVVVMTARTSDGRTGTSTVTVSVRTHDVGITKLVVPQSAQVGKTKTITVEAKSARYDENVSVESFSEASPVASSPWEIRSSSLGLGDRERPSRSHSLPAGGQGRGKGDVQGGCNDQRRPRRASCRQRGRRPSDQGQLRRSQEGRLRPTPFG